MTAPAAEFDPRGPLHTVDCLADASGPVTVLVDPERVRWIGVNRAGAELLDTIRGAPGTPCSFSSENGGGDGVRRATERYLRDCARRGFLANAPVAPAPHRNRRESLELDRLHEFWVVTNDHCNLRCRHCYTIDRVLEGRTGMPGPELQAILGEAHDLGAEVFYFTGGEPTLRDDFLELAEFVLARAKLILFTNGLTISDALAARLARHRDRLVVQVSIEGPSEAVNAPVRGRNSYEKALAGVRALLRHGVRVGVSTTPTGRSREHVAQLTEQLARLEENGHRPDYHHLILLLDRGGALSHPDIAAVEHASFETIVERSAAAIRTAKAALKDVHLKLTNEKIFRALAAHGPAKDYCGAGYTILGVSADGKLLPCAACMDDERFFLGDLLGADHGYRRGTLERLWRESPAVERIRRFSLAPAGGERVRDLRYFHGGGCWKNMPEPGADFATQHPFAAFYEKQMWAAIRAQASEGVAVAEDVPRLYTFMHRDRIACAGERKTRAAPGADGVDQGYCICFA